MRDARCAMRDARCAMREVHTGPSLVCRSRIAHGASRIAL